MKKRSLWRLLALSILLVVPLLVLTGRFLQPDGIARGKSAAIPLAGDMTAEQQQAQELALADPRVQAYTAGHRSEVFGVRQVLAHGYTDQAAACAAADCRQVEIYNFDENAAVKALVNLDTGSVLDVLFTPGEHPGINKRLADRALDIAVNAPEVIEALGYRPTNSTTAPVPGDLAGTSCDGTHLCVAPTFRVADRILWAVVDLTDDTLAGSGWTNPLPEDGDAVPFIPEGCPTPGAVDRDGWTLAYGVTGHDGLEVANAAFNGVDVFSSIKTVEWHVHYVGDWGFRDSTGCSGGGGGYPIYPYGPTHVFDLLDNQNNVIGFEVVQDFRMGNWGNGCNYRYDQRIQFFTDGRFRTVHGAYGRGCAIDGTYRPVTRINIAVNGEEDDNFAYYDGANWVELATEDFRLPYFDPQFPGNGPHELTPENVSWRVTDANGGGYYLEQDLGQFPQDPTGRGAAPFVYATLHHPNEGDTDLGGIGPCCNGDHQQGPELFINGESIANENLVLWYVPQMVTDVTPDDYYCWTVSGQPNPETYPCFAGPMFHPISSEPEEDTFIYLPITQFQTELNLNLDLFATGLNDPVSMAHAGDDRLFVVEQAGRIRMVEADGTLVPAPFLDIVDRVDASQPEMGLLGLVFHPDYATNGYFYVNYTHTGENVRYTRISRFSVTADPTVADPDSENILLTVAQPFPNHNAGDLHFGPDGYLYIPLGDGWGAGDAANNAQNPANILGAVSRIDVNMVAGTPADCYGLGSGAYSIPADNPYVDGSGGNCDEIWAIGLRNPWRSSFDRLTGDFYMGDVGQGSWEEIDFQPAASTGGANYGWRCYEGNHPYNMNGCGPMETYTFPIFEYSSAAPTNNCAVIAGYIYRGSLYPKMTGRYFLTDYCSGNFWDLEPVEPAGWQATEHSHLRQFGFTTFGEVANGELYVANQDGTIYHLTSGN